MAKALKHMLATQVQARLEDSPGGVMVIDPGNMTVEKVMAFRKDLREQAGGARMRVLHNRTAAVAMREMGYDGDVQALDDLLSGTSALVYGGEGPIPIAKVIRDWSRKQKDMKVKAAVADGEILIEAEAAALADMPDLTQLKGMLAGLLVSAARGIAVSLQGVYGGIARCIQARIDDSGFAGGAEVAPAPAEEAPAAEAAPPADEGDETPEATEG